MPHYVYALTVVEQPGVIYIGITQNPKKRLEGHKPNSQIANTVKARWLREALQQGQTPLLTILRMNTRAVHTRRKSV